MEKLIKPAEYAQELGISRQAVYAKIKKGILQSKTIEGKLYIVIEGEMLKEDKASKEKIKQYKPKQQADKLKDYKALLEAKDETISVLKETVIDLKESNNQISTTLKSEIALLKDAFHEMRTLYMHHLEYKKQELILKSTLENKGEEKTSEEIIEIFTHEEKVKKDPIVKWVGTKKFFKINHITKEKVQEKLIKRFKKFYKKGDDRFMKIENKLKLNLNKNYEDILH